MTHAIFGQRRREALPRIRPTQGSTARATDLLPVIAEVRAAGRRHAERDRQDVDGARRADPERPRRLGPATVMRLDRRVPA
jgi:hypothetical protein